MCIRDRDYIFSKFDNGIFAWLYWRLDLLFILYLMIGFVCIFNYYWKKPWGYLDEVIDATQTVYEQNNHTVSLSDPLKELEAQLNQIKMSVPVSYTHLQGALLRRGRSDSFTPAKPEEDAVGNQCRIRQKGGIVSWRYFTLQ